MKLWASRIVRSVVVLIGIIVLTSFTIDATDTLNGSQSALSFLAKRATEKGCAENMIELNLGERSVCIDAYENSLSSGCPLQTPGSVLDMQRNVNDRDCAAVSLPNKTPVVFVTFHQAQTFCARRGGRLPDSYEWYDAALGTPDNRACNLNGTLASTGLRPECISSRGTYDMIGNAWEWVDGEVKAREFEGRTLPAPGFVSSADRAGVALETASVPNPLFNDDYFWSNDAPTAVMMRGGFYRSGEDGGIYSIHADIEPTFGSGAIGFRCVLDL